MSDSSDSEEEMMPGMVMANGKEDVEEEDEGEEMYVDSLGQALDLFSPKTFPTAEECMEHCRYVKTSTTFPDLMLETNPQPNILF